jgi:uncharacterized protein (DUF736 family)
MESKNKNNSGAIFKNAKKTNEKQPDYKGTVNVNGKDMQVSLWVKTSSKDGSKFLSVSFQEPFKKDNQVMTKPDSFSNFMIDSNDDLF